MNTLDEVKSKAGVFRKLPDVFGMDTEEFKQKIDEILEDFSDMCDKELTECQRAMVVLDDVLKIESYDSETVLRMLVVMREFRRIGHSHQSIAIIPIPMEDLMRDLTRGG